MSKIVEQLKGFRSSLSGSQSLFYDFMLDKGELFTTAETLEKKVRFEVIQRGCFRNSLLLSIELGLPYYEGYYIPDIIPIAIEHAFNKVSPNKIIDITAQKFNISVDEWYGVHVPEKVLIDYLNTDQILTPLRYYFRYAMHID